MFLGAQRRIVEFMEPARALDPRHHETHKPSRAVRFLEQVDRPSDGGMAWCRVIARRVLQHRLELGPAISRRVIYLRDDGAVVPDAEHLAFAAGADQVAPIIDGKGSPI